MRLGEAFPGLGISNAEPAADVGRVAFGHEARGQGGTYRPGPGWPPADHLDYVSKLATAGLLVVGFVVLVAYAIANPSGAARVLVRGAKGKAGV